MRIAIVTLLLLAPSIAAAQERSACAQSFSARLAAARTAAESGDTERAFERRSYRPAPEDVACSDEDALHRISLVMPTDPDLRAVQEQEVLCYGSSRPACVQARATLDSYYRARRERAARDAQQPAQAQPPNPYRR